MKLKNILRISFGLFLAFVMVIPAIAQNSKTFKGVVLDETEQPIIGAAVKVVGTTIGTITDFDGNFTLNVPDGKEVEISYIGYVTQHFSAPFKLTKIIMKEDAQQLDEVVVVGYGTQKKAHLTGAIATVPVDEIQDISSGSLANTLSGLVNGVSVSGGDTRPGQNATITIRQNNALENMGNSNLQPLYVIDGYMNGEFIDSNMGRTINPGHCIETAWFLLEESKLRGRDQNIKELGLKILDWSWEWGWDKEFGGIINFKDCRNLPSQDYAQDMKFWWPQTEAIIATLYAYQATGDEKYLQMHQQVSDWAYAHFPDKEYGEWYGYLHRDGTVAQPAKGNLFKGPFHIPRMMIRGYMLCKELL